jgi:hypothetical protein
MYKRKSTYERGPTDAILKYVNIILDESKKKEDPEVYLRVVLINMLTEQLSFRNTVRAFQFECENRGLSDVLEDVYSVMNNSTPAE